MRGASRRSTSTAAPTRTGRGYARPPIADGGATVGGRHPHAQPAPSQQPSSCTCPPDTPAALSRGSTSWQPPDAPATGSAGAAVMRGPATASSGTCAAATPFRTSATHSSRRSRMGRIGTRLLYRHTGPIPVGRSSCIQAHAPRRTATSQPRRRGLRKWAHQDSNLEPRDSRGPMVSHRRGLSLHPVPWHVGCGTLEPVIKGTSAPR